MTRLRVATWNLWNSPHHQGERLEAAAAVIHQEQPDIVALQEVSLALTGTSSPSAAAWLAGICGYPFVEIQPRPDAGDEALAVLSRTPLERVSVPSLDPMAMRVRLQLGDARVALTNLHLDWQRAGTREAQIVSIVDGIEDSARPGHHELLAGDFNATPASSIYRFLMSDQSLRDTDTVPWHDLAVLQAARTDTAVPPTLNKLTNPRWQNDSPLEAPMRIDWILVRDTFNTDLPPLRLVETRLIGEHPAGPAAVVPSDHYGVLVDLEIGED